MNHSPLGLRVIVLLVAGGVSFQIWWFSERWMDRGFGVEFSVI